MERHPLAGYGMLDCQLFSMQIESVGRVTVEGIAENGARQSFAMSTVHSQLMSTTCYRREQHMAVGKYLVTGDSCLAVHVIYYLIRTVCCICPQGKTYLSATDRQLRGEHRHIALSYPMACKLRLQ